MPAGDLDRLGLSPHRDRLGALLPQFEQALGQASKRTVSFGELRARRARGNELLQRVVAFAFVAFPFDDAEADRKRAELLEPVLDQNRRLGESYRRREGESDVDPDTGEVVTPAVQ